LVRTDSDSSEQDTYEPFIVFPVLVAISTGVPGVSSRTLDHERLSPISAELASKLNASSNAMTLANIASIV
jgi:hypothetical protein